ncbi:c-type cytochrome [Sedimenticola sp.]|uniref:c-type cytochrome n=1 Tax=Sedimenticola sp. TaxID=1940285 RepID=UPI003D0D8D12
MIMTLSIETLRRIPALLLLGFTVGMAYAQSPAPDLATQQSIIHELEPRIDALKSDPKQLAQMIDEGRSRTILCRTCHGKEGIAVKEMVPNLAGQNPVYIVDQFQRFGDGRRYDYLMSGLAKSFSDEDKIKIALFYSTLKPQASHDGDPALIPEGEKLFTTICSECHGKDGHGQKGYARLAGQRTDYVVKMLKEFRDRTGRRSNPWMTAVAFKLSEQQMQAVASYIANLE